MEDWAWPDERVMASGGCAGIVRTIHWHERTIAAVCDRYSARVWARRAPPEVPAGSLDEQVANGSPLPGGVVAHWLTDGDEIALWLPEQRVLVFGDAMVRERDGTLRRCPDNWLDHGHRQPERLRSELQALIRLQPAHVVVSHGPVVLGDGPASFERAAAL